MERKHLYLYAGIVIVFSVLVLANIFNYYAAHSANEELDKYKAQEKEFSAAIRSEYMADMAAAQRTWRIIHDREAVEALNDGITIEADTIITQHFSAVLDPGDPSYISIDSIDEDVGDGEVIIGLGKYYTDNMTRVPGWMVMYHINRSDHSVSGMTAGTVQVIAYDYYVSNLAQDIYQNLGVSRDTVTGYTVQNIDDSYTPGTDTWLDVAEYRYTLRNTQVVSYLLIKTYVNGSTEQVKGVEISKPYIQSITRKPDLRI